VWGLASTTKTTVANKTLEKMRMLERMLDMKKPVGHVLGYRLILSTF